MAAVINATPPGDSVVNVIPSGDSIVWINPPAPTPTIINVTPPEDSIVWVSSTPTIINVIPPGGLVVWINPPTSSPIWIKYESGEQGPPGIPGPGALIMTWGEIPIGAINGVNRTYSSTYPYRPNLLAVFLNGLRLRRTDDYLEIGNQSFQFVNAPLSGDSLSIDYIQP